MFENRWKSMEVMCAVHCNPRPLKGPTAAKFLRTLALSSGSLKVGPKSSVSRSTLLRSDFHESYFHYKSPESDLLSAVRSDFNENLWFEALTSSLDREVHSKRYCDLLIFGETGLCKTIIILSSANMWWPTWLYEQWDHFMVQSQHWFSWRRATNKIINVDSQFPYNWFINVWSVWNVWMHCVRCVKCVNCNV